MRYIRIPFERIGVLIGKDGETRKKIEELTQVKLTVNSDLGEVTFNDQDIEDPLTIFKVENIVRAIARGFSPEHAFLLLNDDMDFFVFDIRDYVGNKPTHVHRLKSRVIGTQGKTKRVLEHLTLTNISIYGHTVAIIGNILDIDIAKKAIDKLLSGSKHASVYRYVESTMKKLRVEQGF